jgi:predicted Zn-dependent protease
MRTIQVRILLCVVLGALSSLVGAGCGAGEGPGGRSQSLALSPEQEVRLGEQAYREVLKKHRRVPDGPVVQRVREIGRRIARASEIEPLHREMNLRLKGYTFAWEFNVLVSNQVNAF